MKKTAELKVKEPLVVLKPEDSLRFNCSENLACYTRCCRDITIFLTPYDVIRLKHALHLPSEAFLAKHTATQAAQKDWKRNRTTAAAFE